MSSTSTWSPSSWRSKTVAQDVVYPDQSKLDSVLNKLKHLPPLVTPTEILRLRAHLASVSRGESFLLQGGDCAELFDYCSQDPIEHKLSLILLMSLIIIWGGRLPVVRIARIAGQYAKPRSKATEFVEGYGEIMSFRGDNVNGYEPKDRAPDPDRLLGAYFHSAATLNYIRSLLSSSFASLSTPTSWSFSHVRSPTLQAEFSDVMDRLSDALGFMQTIGADLGGSIEGVEIFTSHEGLSLEYEECLTRSLKIPMSAEDRKRKDLEEKVRRRREGSISPVRNPVEEKKAYFNAGSHYLWIGDRTRQIDGGHVEYFRGLENPVGIKVGPSMPAGELTRLLSILDPEKQDGKISLITRYGASKIDQFLPAHIDEVESSGHRVVWVCDPMHGNTKTAENSSLKTRAFSDIIHEITRSMKIHSEKGSNLGGVHLELTGEVNEEGFSVTECVGGSMELADKDLSTNYQTFCDPRLNYEQSLDVAFLISDHLQAARKGRVSEERLLHALRGRVEARVERRASMAAAAAVVQTEKEKDSN
ncbi:E, aroF, aroG, aroH [Phaffia rhodozyma]|uniref:Phospho-2-dehydro-3-deoxyheptonate aldolase n=1 Tax=Phaffia rhodozyma TaxID=264483 RepID=A0A0F7SSA5_PHARH|nr:E, aroF, aroG, aroH [Phaffia rhodozyma]